MSLTLYGGMSMARATPEPKAGPLLGLVGTIYGLIVLFGGMGRASADESATFARGISLALQSTLMGLLIAIPALVAWSYYNKKVENLAVEMESLCDEFLRKHYRTESSIRVPPRPAAKRERVKVNPIEAPPGPVASAAPVSPTPQPLQPVESDGREPSGTAVST